MDEATEEATTTPAAIFGYDHKPKLKPIFVDPNNFMTMHALQWGFDFDLFQTLVEDGNEDFYRLFNFNVFGAYHFLRNVKKGRRVMKFALKCSYDEIKVVDRTLETTTVKPDLWMEIPFTNQRKSKVGPVSIFAGYAFVSEGRNDFAGDPQYPDDTLGDRWELELRWPFRRGTYGKKSVEMEYRGKFAIFPDDSFGYHELRLKFMLQKKKGARKKPGAITMSIGTGETAPDFQRDFKFSAGFKSGF